MRGARNNTLSYQNEKANSPKIHGQVEVEGC
jgi:hypothetical protein